MDLPSSIRGSAYRNVARYQWLGVNRAGARLDAEREGAAHGWAGLTPRFEVLRIVRTGPRTAVQHLLQLSGENHMICRLGRSTTFLYICWGTGNTTNQAGHRRV